MKNQKYTTIESVEIQVKGYNELNKLTDKVLTKIKTVFDEGVVGKKVKSVTNNSLTKQMLKLIPSYSMDNGVGYKLWFEGDYLMLTVYYCFWNGDGSRRYDFKNEISILVTDNEGNCKRLIDFEIPFRPQTTVRKQWRVIQKVAELQKQLDVLQYEIIQNLR